MGKHRGYARKRHTVRRGGHRALAAHSVSPAERIIGKIMEVARNIGPGQRRSLILADCAIRACAEEGVKIDDIKPVLFSMLTDKKVIDAIDKRLRS